MFIIKSKCNVRILIVKRKNIVRSIIFMVFLGLIFCASGRIYSEINNNTIKATLSNSMDLRESKVYAQKSSMDSETTDVYKPDGYKIAFLTFDDGPSAKTTPAVLKILDHYNIKATFFVIGSMAIINPNILKEEVKDGHSIGNHTFSHNYQYIYSSANAFISDVKKCDIVLKSIIGTGYNSKLLRFPGGSFGPIREPLRAAIKDSGYHYIDWNDLTGDAEAQNVTVSKLLSNLKKYTKGKEHVVILMHDAYGKETTVQALPQVVEYLKSQGYSFSTLK